MTTRALLALAMVASALTSLLSGCASEDTPDAKMSIVGTWRLVQMSGGISGAESIPLPSTNMTIEFTEDGEVRWYENNVLTHSASYNTGVEKTIFSSDPLPVINLSDGWGYVYSFPDDNTLLLGENACDGLGYGYQRL